MFMTRTGFLKSLNHCGYEYEGVKLLSSENKVISLEELVPQYASRFIIRYYSTEEDFNNDNNFNKEFKNNENEIIILGEGKPEDNYYIDIDNTFKHSFKIEEKIKTIHI